MVTSLTVLVMIKVNVKKHSSYPVSSVFIKSRLKIFLRDNGIVSDSEVDVAIVSKERMVSLGKRFLGETGESVHNVLSFSDSETSRQFLMPQGRFNYLGEIVVCYPVVVEEAKKMGVLIDDRLIELVEHGALHLLGVHHD